MAGDTTTSALHGSEAFGEPRQIEGRLLMGAGLALFGGLLWALFLMGDDLQRNVGTINSAYSGSQQPTTCGSQDLPVSAKGVAAAIGPQRSLNGAIPPEMRAQPAAAGVRSGAAGTTARDTSSMSRSSKPAPTYIRRPEPEPPPAAPALDALRRSL